MGGGVWEMLGWGFVEGRRVVVVDVYVYRDKECEVDVLLLLDSCQ